MTQHTPGPWIVGGPFITCDSGIHKVARVQEYLPRFAGEQSANARLIAAAPELLAALQAVADYWAGGDVPADIDAAVRTAIAKATGGEP